jgi:hypothetical protein
MRRARAFGVAALCVAGLLAAREVGAQGAPSPYLQPPALGSLVEPSALLPPLPPPPPRPARHWYGWQILAPVGVGDALFWIGLLRGGKDAGAIAGTGVWMHLLSGSIIHLGHRQWAKAGASVGLNVAAPLALGFVGAGFGYIAMIFTPNDPHADGMALAEVAVGGVAGMMLGGMAATVLDSMALAYEPVDAKPRARALPGPTFSLIPMIGPGRTGLGVGGLF